MAGLYQLAHNGNKVWAWQKVMKLLAMRDCVSPTLSHLLPLFLEMSAV